MNKLVMMAFSLLFMFVMTACDKETKLKNLLEGKTWDATVTTQISSDTEVYSGTFTFDKEEFDYTSSLTDSDGNTITNVGNYFVGPEATTLTLQDSTGSITYSVNINERKKQEWSYSETIDGTSIYSKIELSR
jgi:hypothetical protein